MRIRELRQELGMTQEELGRKINQTKSNVSKYETGTLEPNIQTLNLLSDIFDVSIDYLVGKSNIKKQDACIGAEMHELMNNLGNLSEESKKELEKYVQLLNMKDQLDKSKEEQSSVLEKEA
ncbi:helix-turn-helix domain protein [Alkaliphilus metalliredigens QYMF]|uniref:Helix-turn-helix domain protein n=1 Tax=Alkaliphilus metalliredigens (strain QYMF) TaxID=293826 RepID=A6TRE7_ALKMQ|nr:helix-turn-helix transcriptional regulator [Alkaliphilus metalliredigens]ABR48765.1 helix-turn-helix domain protein [Alkaliphilus metalliredigens QYMF]